MQRHRNNLFILSPPVVILAALGQELDNTFFGQPNERAESPAQRQDESDAFFTFFSFVRIEYAIFLPHL
jgi:hypothetical protein